MTDYFSAHADALESLMDSLGADCPTMFWSNQEIRAMPSGAGASSTNSPGGFSLSADATLVCLVSDFAGEVPPDSSQQIVYPGMNEGRDGDIYKIVSRKISAGGKLISLVLESSAQGL